MAEHPQKRLRTELLQSLLHTGGTTTKALAKILKQIRESPTIVEHGSLALLQRANLELFMRFRHIEPLTLCDGSVFNWEMCHPNRMLSEMVDRCPQLQDIFIRAVNRHPCTEAHPWSLVIGFDEFCPGNKLKSHNERKCMNLSFSFIELGLEALWRETTWMTPICVRHSIIAKVPGGWSHMFRKYLRLHLLGDTGLSTAGLPLMLAGKPFLLFAKFRHLIGDGDGLRMVWDWKGANGFKPCFRHSNVVSKGSDVASRDSRFVEITCSDHRCFRTTTAAEVATAVDVLLQAQQKVAAGTMTKTRFSSLQKVYGLHGSPEGVLADADLRRHFDCVKVTTMDWVHSALQDGTVTIESFLLISACEKIGVTSMDALVAYFKSGWIFPAACRARGRALCQVFEAARNPAHEKLKCTFTELLGLYGLLRHFVQTRVGTRADIAAELASFSACCKAVDIIKCAKRGDIGMRQASTLLKAALEDHMRKHISAYGEAHIRPKHHWLFDVAEQLEELPCVIDAFIVERLHLRIKAIAEPVECTTSFERSVLAGVLTSQVRSLNDADFKDGLRGKAQALPGCAALFADRLEFKGLAISFADIVMRVDGATGQVIACAVENEVFYVLIEIMDLVTTVSPQSAKYKCTKAQQVWRVDSVQLALAWYLEGDVVVVLRL